MRVSRRYYNANYNFRAALHRSIPLKMADNSRSAAKMARILAIIQIITGGLMLGFGIADRLVEYRWTWTGYVYFGIWIGVWMCITGGLGIPGSARERTNSRDAFAGVFMGFSITSAVMGGTIIICYSIVISSISDYGSYYDYGYERGYYSYDGKMAILAIMLILGIIAFGTGIWAAICACLMKPCACCAQPVDQQMYGFPAAGHVMTQMSAGSVPVALPVQAMQAGAGGAAAQGYHQPMVLVPASGAAGGQMIVQAASPEGMATDTLQQQQEGPSFTRAGYVALHD